MNWNNVPPLWQACFELAWEACREGSNPIGALVADPTGAVLTTGKSAVRAALSNVVVSNCEIAHAEVNALLQLDNRVHPKDLARHYTLYVSLEPCPVCMSAFYMSDVKQLKYAAKDRYGGSTNLIGTTPYLSRKPVKITGPVSHLEDVSIFLNVYHDTGLEDQPDIVHREFEKDYPKAVQLARKLGPGDKLNLSGEAQFAPVYDAVSRLLST